MYCSQCGKQLAESSKFCSYCGAKVADTTTQKAQGMYSLYAPSWYSNDVLKKLLKEVLGYNDEEIKILEAQGFGRVVANNLTIEQAKIIAEIFEDNDFCIYLNDGRGYDGIILWKEIGITLQENPPKEHYCYNPLISRNQLADLSIPKPMPSKPKTISISRVECPYCHSTNVHKLDNRHMDIIGGNLIGGNLAQLGKNFHCNRCGADF